MDDIFLSLNGKPELHRRSSGCPLVRLAHALNTQKNQCKENSSFILGAKLIDEKIGTGNVIQSI